MFRYLLADEITVAGSSSRIPLDWGLSDTGSKLRVAPIVSGGTRLRANCVPMDFADISATTFANDAGRFARQGQRDYGGDLSGISFTQLDNSAPVMFTGQLSGCSFVWYVEGPGAQCAHIMPARGNANGLANTLRRTHTNVYGADQYGQATVNIVGVRHGGADQWWFFAQSKDNANGKVLQVKELTSGEYRNAA